MGLKITESQGAILFGVRVVPRAGREAIAGLHGQSLKVRLTAPPAEGKANQALITFLAKRLEVSREQVEIVTGQRSRQKTIAVRGVSLEEVTRRLFEGE
ncbi:MAG: DUF167 domain-containing protein [Anaerolineae bacterium]